MSRTSASSWFTSDNSSAMSNPAITIKLVSPIWPTSSINDVILPSK
ncbi:MAG: hypothetical protein O7F69_07240 [Alphaproteobacteria bacterium]|nr:hypothetical protein [Alphaproteobacteria bacterium]